MKKKTKTPPAYVEPMQCKPVTALPDTDGWLFEIKLDGYRCIAVKIGERVDLVSRNAKPLSSRFPNVVQALCAIEEDFVVDGEIVALDEEGRPSFQTLQNSRSREAPIHFFVFDVLNIGGRQLLKHPLSERRKALERLLNGVSPPLRISPVLQGPSATILNAVQDLGLEGVVAKRLASVYEPGERSGAWIKMRTNRAQDFVIGGYIPASAGFDALLVGVYEGDELRYVAKVTSGFVPRTRVDQRKPPPTLPLCRNARRSQASNRCPAALADPETTSFDSGISPEFDCLHDVVCEEFRPVSATFPQI